MSTSEDSIDEVIQRWEERLPALDFSSLHIVSRLLRLIRIFERDRQVVLTGVGLESWSFDTLAVIRRSPAGTTTPGELSSATLVTLGTMTTRLKSLEARGWLTRTPSADDRRVVRVSLTQEGTARFDAVVADVLGCQRRLTDTLSAQEQAQLGGLLRTMLGQLEE